MSIQLPDRRAADHPVMAPPWQPPEGAPPAGHRLPPPTTPWQQPDLSGYASGPAVGGSPGTPPPTAPGRDHPALAVTALVLGLVELLLVLPVLLLLSEAIYPRPGSEVFAAAIALTAPAVVVGVIAVRRGSSRGLAVAGLVTGVLAMLGALGLLALGHATPTLGSTVQGTPGTVVDPFDGTTLFDEWDGGADSGRVEDGRMVMTTDGDLVVNWVNVTEPPQTVALEVTLRPARGAVAGLGVAQGYDALYTVHIDLAGTLVLVDADGDGDILDVAGTGPVATDGATLTLTVTVGDDGTELTAARTDVDDAGSLTARVEDRPVIDRLCIVLFDDGVGSAWYDDFRAEF